MHNSYGSASTKDAIKGFLMLIGVLSLPVAFIGLAFAIYGFSQYHPPTTNIDIMLKTKASTFLRWNCPPCSINMRFNESYSICNPWNISLTLYVFYNASLLTVQSNIRNGSTTISPYGIFIFDFAAVASANLINQTSIIVKGLGI